MRTQRLSGHSSASGDEPVIPRRYLVLSVILGLAIAAASTLYADWVIIITN